MITYYGSSISPNKVETSEGFLICRNVPIARIGQQVYLARELQLDGDPNREINVNRYEVDVFDKRTIASFEGKPVTDTHPSSAVDSENFSDLAKGHAQNVRREGDFLVADLYINDAGLIQAIQSGQKKEVSCGYLCNYEPDGDGYKQTHIRGNHVAVVQSGRAGHDVAIKDAAAEPAEERTLMSKFSKAVLTAFGVAAKDAKDEELKALTNLAVTALDSDSDEPAEKAPEPEKKEEPVKDEDKEAEEEETKDAEPASGLEAKLDKLIEMLSALMPKQAGDEDPDEKEEEETKDEDPEEKSEVVEEETEDACEEPVENADAFMAVIRPAIAAISNKDERAKVSKAIQNAVKTADLAAIFKATSDAAQAASSASAKTNYERMCETQTNAYASRNPHMKKEEK